MFKVPEEYRVTKGGNIFMRTTAEHGNNGVFIIPYNPTKVKLYCIASDGLEWDHVSVTAYCLDRCPKWEEMCYVKSLFWDDDNCVIQYHPQASEYVNVHPYCLHLWRPQTQSIPQPSKFMVE
jgi:hypothetical protein